MLSRLTNFPNMSEATIRYRQSTRHRLKIKGKLDQYARQTLRPLVSLIFVLPLILLYEIATLSGEELLIRSGLDQWIDYFLSGFGFGQIVFLPLLTTGILIYQHHRIDDLWRIDWSVFGWMKVESIAFGTALLVLASFFYLVGNFIGQPHETDSLHALSGSWESALILIGSGIYEELFFRLILLSLTVKALERWTKFPHQHWLAIGIVSWLFAVSHYNIINPAGADFALASFLFRFVASVYFSVLFLRRGFGIAVGTHVVFDLLTLLVERIEW